MEKNNPKIILMGTSDFAAEVLEALAKKYPISAVFTQPDKEAGRKKILLPSPVKVRAEKNSIAVYAPNKLDEEVVAQIKTLAPDLIILVAYGKIIPQSILDIPPQGILNVHASLLPQLRGASPIQGALLQGLTKTGTTIMRMDAGVDTGDILAQKEVAIDPDDCYPQLEKKLIASSIQALLETLPLYLAGKINPVKQDATQASFCQLIRKEDGLIDWNKKAKEIYNQYRAFYVWPGVYSFWENGETQKRIKLMKISPVERAFPGLAPGEVFSHLDSILVATPDGAIQLEQVRLEGKGETDIKSFINGYPDFIGAMLR